MRVQIPDHPIEQLAVNVIKSEKERNIFVEPPVSKEGDLKKIIWHVLLFWPNSVNFQFSVKFHKSMTNKSTSEIHQTNH